MSRLAIYIPDRTYGQEDESEEKSLQLKAQLEAELQCALEDADIGPGASFPAFLLELSQAAWPYLAMALYVFFKGKDVQDNLKAWPELYKKLSPFRKHDPYFNRESAAVVAVNEIAAALSNEPRSLRLIAYNIADATGGPFDLDAISGIADDSEERYVGWIAHLFHIEVDGRTFKVVVQGNQVSVIEVT